MWSLRARLRAHQAVARLLGAAGVGASLAALIEGPIGLLPGFMDLGEFLPTWKGGGAVNH